MFTTELFSVLIDITKTGVLDASRAALRLGGGPRSPSRLTQYSKTKKAKTSLKTC